MEPSNLIQLLTGYGLTKNQAKIINTLTQTDNYLNVKQISQTTNIPRESIYNILHNLSEKGLIEKTITKPEKYHTIPLKRILKLLHETKIIKIHKLEALTTQALMDNNQTPKNNHIEDKTHYVLIPKKIQLTNKINQAISNSKKNVKIITSWKRYLQSMIVHEKALTTAINNGTKIQVFITLKTTKNQIPKKAKFFHDSPNFSIKFVEALPKIISTIIDNQEVFLITDPQSDLEESSALWSNNQSLINALTTCFDVCWKT